MKNKNKNKLAKVYHYDLYGKRDEKYKFLEENTIDSVEWNELDVREPDYFFVMKNFTSENQYKSFFSLKSLLLSFNPGVESGRDNFFVDYSKLELEEKIINVFEQKYSSNFKLKYGIKDTKSFKFQSNLDVSIFDASFIRRVSYRPFDLRFTYYDKNLQRRASYDTFRHLLENNIGLIFKRGFDEINSAPIFIIDTISDRRGWTRAGMQGAESIAPLYLYPEEGEQQELGDATTPPNFVRHPSTGGELARKPNLDMELVGKIAEGLGLEFRDIAPWDEEAFNSKIDSTVASLPLSDKPYFTPIDLLDYIYAVLHSPTYREKYKEFLKIDFPRVPYPTDKEQFWKLVDVGSEIRQLHLLETADNYITTYPVDGSNIVTRKMTKNSIGFELTNEQEQTGRVWINDEQYFEGVPQVAWEFYIGGYQPAQKWLKDRRDRELKFEDILHYQKIIVALTETDRLMKEVDAVGVEW